MTEEPEGLRKEIEDLKEKNAKLESKLDGERGLSLLEKQNKLLEEQNRLILKQSEDKQLKIGERVIFSKKTLYEVLILLACISTILTFFVTYVFVGHVAQAAAPTPVPTPPTPAFANNAPYPTINFTPLSPSELSQLNDFPAQTLVLVAKGLLNGSLDNTLPTDSNTQYGIFPLSLSGKKLNTTLMTNGKIDFYFGGDSACQFCGRDRWAVILALSQFGSFSDLYSGYTWGDQNYTTLFWQTGFTNNTYGSYIVGSSYSSSTIDFISTDGYPINGHGFTEPSASGMEEANPAIAPLFTYGSVDVTNGYFPTPLEAFGNYMVNGAFTDVPVPYESAGTIINSFYAPGTGQFALATIAGADMYIADMCTINESAGKVCSDYNWTGFYNQYG